MPFRRSNEPERVQAAGNDLRCQICGSYRFWRRKAQLNTAVAAFFDLNWANRSASCYICDVCGYIHWFLAD